MNNYEQNNGERSELYVGTKTGRGFFITYMLDNGHKVEAHYVRPDKTAYFFIDNKEEARIVFMNNKFANTTRAYTAVRRVLDGFLSTGRLKGVNNE